MNWNVLYLILAICCVIAAVWRLARGGNTYLVITCILWFVSVLFTFFVKSAYNVMLSKHLPSLGSTIHYILVPIFLILSLNSIRRKY